MSGVLSRCRMPVQHRVVMRVSTTENSTARKKALNMERRIRSCRLAPKWRAKGMPKPAHIPMQKPMTRNCTLLEAPTPARASAPR